MPPETPVGPIPLSWAWVMTDYNLASVLSKGHTFGVRPILGKGQMDWTPGNTGKDRFVFKMLDGLWLETVQNISELPCYIYPLPNLVG